MGACDSPLPSPFDHQDIGAVGAPGCAGAADGVFTISASGADIWGSADELHYVYQPLTGNAQITARIAAVDHTHDWAKAGVMIRETLAANSKHAHMLVSAAGTPSFQRRLTTGGGSSATNGTITTFPQWVRLRRDGDTFTGFVSPDGVTWTQVGTDTVAMNDTVHVGLSLTSHADGTLGNATFDNVTIGNDGGGGSGGAGGGSGGAGGGSGGAGGGSGGAGGGGGSGGAGGGSGGSGGTSGAGGSSGAGGASGTGCDSPNLVWKTARKTWYTSYPDPNSEECIRYNGCFWAGQFAACSQKKSEAWVEAHNIAAFFPNFDDYKLHDLCLKSGSKTIVVTVLDTCADSDCSGCCTDNQGNHDALIDLESYTNERWGVADGTIQWADLGPTTGGGCN
jgi:hypothetical protein